MSTNAFVAIFITILSLLLQKAFDNSKDDKCLNMCHQQFQEHWYSFLAKEYPIILAIFLSVSLI